MAGGDNGEKTHVNRRNVKSKADSVWQMKFFFGPSLKLDMTNIWI